MPGSDEHIDAAVMSTKLVSEESSDGDKWAETETKSKKAVIKSGKGLGDLTELYVTTDTRKCLFLTCTLSTVVESRRKKERVHIRCTSMQFSSPSC